MRGAPRRAPQSSLAGGTGATRNVGRLNRSRLPVRLRRLHGQRRSLSVRAPCLSFRNGRASALFDRRRTAWPLLPGCRSSGEMGSRHSRGTPFRVCGWRPVANPRTPLPTSWLSIRAVVKPVARVFPPPGARTCRHQGRQRHSATCGGSGTSAAVWDEEQRQCTGDGGGGGTAATGASLNQSGAATAVDAVALATSGAAPRGGDDIDENAAPPPPQRRRVMSGGPTWRARVAPASSVSKSL